MSLGRDSENWRAISGYPDYQVSDIGRVRKTTTWKISKISVGKHGYAVVGLCYERKWKIHLVHRLVAFAFVDNPNDKTYIDHRDRCKTNNFATNLRWCSNGENMCNVPKRRGSTSSTYKGVSWNKLANKWVAGIRLNNRRIHLGYFSDEREAARAYDAKALELFGEFANINGIAPDDDNNTDPQDSDNPELTPTSEFDEFTAESGDVEEDVD
jgi:hypothetical protein